MIHNSTHNQGSEKRVWFIGALTALVVFLWVVSPRPTDLRVANVTARSISVGWATESPSRGCIVLIPKPQWWRVLVRCAGEKAGAHLLAFDGLEEENLYRVGYLSGLRWQFWGMPTVRLAKIREEPPPLPQPAYGKVENQFGDPLPNTLIYLYSLDSKARAPLAAMTNEQGNYGLDLANSLAPAGTFVVEVIHGASERARFEGDIRMIQPLPTITIETNKEVGSRK